MKFGMIRFLIHACLPLEMVSLTLTPRELLQTDGSDKGDFSNSAGIPPLRDKGSSSRRKEGLDEQLVNGGPEETRANREKLCR